MIKLNGKKYLRVVFIRAQKSNIQLSLLDDLCEEGYAYYSIITNIEEVEMDNEKVIQFYRGRANAENFIREQKNGFDSYHFLYRMQDVFQKNQGGSRENSRNYDT